MQIKCSMGHLPRRTMILDRGINMSYNTGLKITHQIDQEMGWFLQHFPVENELDTNMLLGIGDHIESLLKQEAQKSDIVTLNYLVYKLSEIGYALMMSRRSEIMDQQ